MVEVRKGAWQAGADGFMSWDWGNDGGYFTKGEEGRDGIATTPRGFAIIALKVELAALGFNGNETTPTMKLDLPVFGTSMAANVKNFQQSVGLEADAVVGPRTCKALAHNRVVLFEERLNIPGQFVCKQIDLESSWYPAARNSTDDFALGQVHDPWDATFVSDGSPFAFDKDGKFSWELAYRFGRNIRYVAEHLKHSFVLLDRKYERDSTSTWNAAIFSYNAPAWADSWLRDGCPATGGGTVTVGNFVGDKYEWATLYVDAVTRRTC